MKIDLHFRTFKDPFLLEGVEKSWVGAWSQCRRRGPRKEALLVLCNFNDSVVGPHLGGSIASLQDARQVVGQGPGHKVLRAT